MARGIIYLMTTAVPGLVKIGKTSSSNFSQRMYHLENNGYRNVSSLKRVFAIEVEDYDEKELLLHTIFEKSRVADTELFALDVGIVKKLLSSFAGNIIYPATETREVLFEQAVDESSSIIIPDGTYFFNRRKQNENKYIKATAKVVNGNWTILKGAVVSLIEGSGMPEKAKEVRETMPLDADGILLDNFSLGGCSPSLAGNVLMNASCNGWTEWKTAAGEKIDRFRRQQNTDD